MSDIGKDEKGRTVVVTLGCVTRLDLPVDRILDMAKVRDLEGVVVMGWDKDGEEYFASSYADGGSVLWLLEKLKQRLMDQRASASNSAC